MPRRHKPTKHTPFTFARNEGDKVRYGSKQAAEKAAELRMLQYPNLRLSVYKALNGGWYLTSQTRPNN